MTLANRDKMLIRYFSTDENPVTEWEFLIFWASLTEKEKFYYRRVNLETGYYRLTGDGGKPCDTSKTS